jgi:hypothetical protein
MRLQIAHAVTDHTHVNEGGGWVSDWPPNVRFWACFMMQVGRVHVVTPRGNRHRITGLLHLTTIASFCSTVQDWRVRRIRRSGIAAGALASTLDGGICDAACVIAIRLVRLRLRERFHMTRPDPDDGEPGTRQPLKEPLRQGPGLETDPFNVQGRILQDARRSSG